MINMKDDLLMRNEEEVRRVYLRIKTKLFNYLKNKNITISPQDAQDIIQDVILKIIDANLIEHSNVSQVITECIMKSIRHINLYKKMDELDSIYDSGSDDIVDVVYSSTLKKPIEDVLNTLPPREAKVLKLRHGLIDGKERTFEELVDIFMVSQGRIRQIEAKALRRLRFWYLRTNKCLL